MSRAQKFAHLPPVRVTIEGLTHEGRGVARVEGKTVFVDGALPGEEISFRYTARKKSFDEGEVAEIHQPSPDRVTPRCPHFGLCGGCALQHLAPMAQIRSKQQVLLDDFQHIGGVTPATLLPPLEGLHWGYRRKARLGVKYVIKKGRLLVGFRERRSPYLADLSRCEVLHPSVGERITQLAELIGTLDLHDRIAQLEVAVDDQHTALVLRNLAPLTESDRARLIEFAQQQQLWLYLQPGGNDTVTPLWPEQMELSYRLGAFEVEFGFGPTDFTQVNYEINQQMVERAVALLDPQPTDRVLDLFCGIGNFSLPLARRAAEVVGVEGASESVVRARQNAERNGITNAQFHAADLTTDLAAAPWWRGGFDKALLDPPRSGAQETLEQLAKLKVGRIVYVSCNPATLARDAGILVKEYGYRLEQAGVMDMFPHTAHVESIALFVKRR